MSMNIKAIAQILFVLPLVTSFPVIPNGNTCWQPSASSTFLSASASASTSELKEQIRKEIEPTSRGLKVKPEQTKSIENLIQSLEAKCPSAPARSPFMDGNWIVDYSTAPPPSNGRLGIFNGIARQIINLEEGTYVNYLSVPGDIQNEWLSARLEATFEEWDGVYLDEKGLSTKDDGPCQDYGADSWRVDFKTLTIKVFGIPIVKQTFDEGTSRVWRMSYLDQDGSTRIVRAGRTGRAKDDMLFYMSRDD